MSLKRLAMWMVLVTLLLSQVAMAQVSLPYIFTPNTVISSSQVNADFAALANQSLNRSGGSLTGNVTSTGKWTTSSTAADSIKTAGGITAGSGVVGIIGTDGRIPALSSTYVANAASMAVSVVTTSGTQAALTVPSAGRDGLIILNNTSDLTVQGMTAGQDGQVVTLRTANTGLALFVYESGSASAANRLSIPVTSGVGYMPLGPNGGHITFVYCSACGGTGRWEEVDHDQGSHISYGSTSTIVGYSSFTTQTIDYLLQGRILRIWWTLEGTSNSTTTSFTMPFTAAGAHTFRDAYDSDNGTPNANATVDVTDGSAVATVKLNATATSWTATGTKISRGTLAVEVH